MEATGQGRAARPFRFAFLGAEVFFVCITVGALLDRTLGLGLGLGWTEFFVGVLATAWGAVLFPVVGLCCGWDGKRERR